MGSGANTANPLGEGPRIARVAAFQNHFQAAPHRAAGHRIADDIVLVEVDLATHVAFNARDWIDNDALAAVVQGKAVRGLDGVHKLSFLWVSVFLCLLMETAAWAAMPTPTAPAVTKPILSALASTPNTFSSVTLS